MSFRSGAIRLLEEPDVEKKPLRTALHGHTPPARRHRFKNPNTFSWSVIGSLSAALILLGATGPVALHYFDSNTLPDLSSLDLCPQYPPLAPPKHQGLDANRDIIYSSEYLNHSVALLAGAVKIRTESYDDNGPVGEDPRWETFFKLEEYLQMSFPLLHSKLNLTKVNTHGLLYTWSGSDSSLQPIILMAHQDVVGVNPATESEWRYPPWSGIYDGKSLWGRGSVDCKDTLIASLEAVTLLLEKEFEPRRTVLLSFGFDEESKGTDGAGALASHIESVYGKDSVAFILDEGGLGVGEKFGQAFAFPSTGEKGYMDVVFSLHTPGGHSSIPPPHTSIGIASSLIHSLEASPYFPSISAESPIFTMLQCAAVHAESGLPAHLKKDIASASQTGKKGSEGRKKLAKTYAELGREERYLVSTSQAVDVIRGGLKTNALPETTTFTINYRISVDSTPHFVKDTILSHVLPIAKQHGLNVTAFDSAASFMPDDGVPLGGELIIVGNSELAPAPVTPTDSLQWQVLASTIQHTFAQQFPDGLIVSPSLMGGNGDTQFYWNLSKHIYRFSPSDPVSDEYIHTVNEHLLFSDHINAVWFYHELIRNSEAADFDN